MDPADILICVYSCQAYRLNRQQAVRDTWISTMAFTPRILFVEGGYDGDDRIEGDRLLLNCPDGYKFTHVKTFSMIEACLKLEPFKYLMKVDDDVYLHTERFFDLDLSGKDYIGQLPTVRPVRQMAQYADGGLYIISEEAAKKLVSKPLDSYSERTWMPGYSDDWNRDYHDLGVEDLMVGDILRENGIELQIEPRFRPCRRPTPFESTTVISSKEHQPRQMQRVHYSRRVPYVLNRMNHLLFKVYMKLYFKLKRTIQKLKNSSKELSDQ